MEQGLQDRNEFKSSAEIVLTTYSKLQKPVRAVWNGETEYPYTWFDENAIYFHHTKQLCPEMFTQYQ